MRYGSLSQFLLSIFSTEVRSVMSKLRCLIYIDSTRGSTSPSSGAEWANNFAAAIPMVFNPGNLAVSISAVIFLQNGQTVVL